MIAVINCRQQDSEPNWAPSRGELLELLDRPVIQHTIEYLVQLGIQRCVMLTHDTARFQDLMGDGTKWGCTIEYLADKDVIEAIAQVGETDQGVVIANGLCIPRVEFRALRAESYQETSLFYHFRSRGQGWSREWTGWAFLAAAHAQLLRAHANRSKNFLQHLDDLSIETRSETLDVCVSVLSTADFLRSQRMILEGKFPELITFARQVSKDVWMARNAFAHDSATLQGPVFMGENARLVGGATVERNVVISRNSIVDAGTRLANACILPGTYVGSGLYLQEVVVAGNRIYDVTEGLNVAVDDPTIIAALSTR